MLSVPNIVSRGEDAGVVVLKARAVTFASLEKAFSVKLLCFSRPFNSGPVRLLENLSCCREG
jgi:hypothetical protein